MRVLHRTRSCAVLTLAVGLAVSGCASGGGGGGGSLNGPITRAELETVAASDAYEAIQALRSLWLRSRASPTPNEPNPQPVVYVDGAPRGGLQELRSLSVQDIESINYINGRDATTRWGTGHHAGVIEIRTRRS